jgi:hypothetical protein
MSCDIVFAIMTQEGSACLYDEPDPSRGSFHSLHMSASLPQARRCVTTSPWLVCAECLSCMRVLLPLDKEVCVCSQAELFAQDGDCLCLKGAGAP